MKHWGLYRFLAAFLPGRGEINFTDLPDCPAQAARAILRRHRCVGATLCLFDSGGKAGVLSFGQARRQGMPAQEETVYRAASVSKLVTALGAMKLAEQGRLSLDEDVNAYLPFSLRHPLAKETPVTLRMLLSHTAGLHDGAAYSQGISRGEGLSVILRGDSFCAHPPGAAWEYSNLGAGIAGVVMEAAAGADFEALMQETVFAPLSVAATYYPQKVRGVLADAYRILPPGRKPNFPGDARQKRPLPAPCVDAERHYALAHGNLCVSAPELGKLGLAAMVPGFLAQDSLAAMRAVVAPFGARARNLSQGIGTFILREPAVSPRPIYGHQGMAYGAVHGLFFDPALGRGMALLTSGASEARRGVLADLNREMLKLFLGGENG